MTSLVSIEDALIAGLVEAFADTVREIASVPAQLDDDELARVLRQAPGIYVSFLGAREVRSPPRTMMGSWGVYLVAANAAGERARRRGDTVTIGAYEMVEVAAATLQDLEVPDVGAASVVRVENLFSAAFAKAGRAVYGVVVDLPLPLAPGLDPATLADFERFHANWDMEPHGNVEPPLPADETADATDHVELPSGSG